MSAEKEMMQAFSQFVEGVVVDGDVERSLAVVADDVLAVGMGEQGTASCKEELRPRFKRTESISGAAYSVTYENTKINEYSGGFGVVCSAVHIFCTVDGATTQSSLIQSVAMRQQQGKWLICACQATPLTVSQESIEAYPLQFADHTLAQLRSDIQKDALELTNQSLSGGVLGAFITEDALPLYYANDSMAAHLGYSREEFYERFKNDTLEIVFPEDRAAASQRVHKALEEDKDYQLRFRLQKKDGSLLWSIERARKTTSADGRPILLSIFTDVTEMVEMQTLLEAKTRQLEEQAEELSAQNEQLLAQQESLEEQAKELIVSEERFRIALEKTSNTVLDYDVATKSILFSGAPKGSNPYVRLGEISEHLIDGGTVAEESLEGLYAAFRAIEGGKPQAACVIKVNLAAGDETWNKISLTGIADCNGEAVRAIGLIEDITKQKKAEIAYAREEQYRRAILSDAMAFYVINFTENVFESCQVRDSRSLPTQANQPYDSFMNQLAKVRMNEEDGRAFINTFSKVSVMEAFERGETELKLEYNALNPDGTDIWMQTVIRLVLDSETNDKKGFLYVTNIDQRKREEIALLRKSESDSLTGLYNKSATEAHIREKLNTLGGVQTGVFMMLDLDFFKEVNDTYGHPFGDIVLTETAKVLLNTVRENDIVGRLGGDEFCVFLCGIRTEKRVEELAKMICEGVHNIFAAENGIPGLSCSIGIAMCDGTPKTFEKIYKEADTALYTVKAKGKNGYAFFGGANYQPMSMWVQNAEWILDKVDAAFYICDKETYNLLYVNEKVLNLFHTDRNKCFGRKCYQVLAGRTTPCDFCSMNRLTAEHSLERLYTFGELEKKFLMKGQLVNWNGVIAHLEMAVDVTDLKNGTVKNSGE